MELQHEKAMQEHGLKFADLPEDAQIGIKELEKVTRVVKVNEAKGHSPSASTIKKIKAMDKWIHFEILDMLADTDKNEDEIPYEADEVIDEIKDSVNESYDDDEEEEEEEEEEEDDDEEDDESESEKEKEIYRVIKNRKAGCRVFTGILYRNREWCKVV